MNDALHELPSTRRDAAVPMPPQLEISQDDWLCPGCGYSLRAISSDRCPECGLEIDRTALAVLQTPWTHRKQIGAWRAYRRTVWMTISQSSRIASDVAGLVSLKEARRFRLITAALLYGSVLASLAATMLPGVPHSLQELLRPAQWGAGLAQGGLLVVCLLSLWLACLSVTGVVSSFCHPGRISISRQNRAIALSHYACGPLALLPVSAGAYFAVRSHDWSKATSRWAYIAFGLETVGLLVPPLVAILGWWLASVVIFRRTTVASALSTLLVAVMLPVEWCFLFLVISLGLPVAYVLLVIFITGIFS